MLVRQAVTPLKGSTQKTSLHQASRIRSGWHKASGLDGPMPIRGSDLIVATAYAPKVAAKLHAMKPRPAVLQ
jgi:hypothetical protein